MRIYNGKSCAICVPMLGTNRNLELGPHQCSGNIMPTNEFLTLLTQTFTPDEIAFIVAGTFEYNVCANIKMAYNFVFPSLDECIEHFNKLNEKNNPTKPEPVEELAKAEKIEEPAPVVAAEPEPIVEEPVVIEEAPKAEESVVNFNNNKDKKATRAKRLD